MSGSTFAAPIEPTWESLAANYEVPEWFQDGKIGVWTEWHSVKQNLGDSAVRFLLMGSNLESVDYASFVKIPRNDPDAVSKSKIH